MFEAVLKSYNDQVDGVMNVIQLMKQRILGLEQAAVEQKRTEK